MLPRPVEKLAMQRCVAQKPDVVAMADEVAGEGGLVRVGAKGAGVPAGEGIGTGTPAWRQS
jgi:hypothetical protein